MNTIKKEISSYQIVLSILSSKYYNESVVHLLKNLDDKKICYVTLNKPVDSLMSEFKKYDIPSKNIFFIDTVTISIDSGKEYANTILVSSPFALTELSIAISEVLKTKEFDIVFFDSLSTLNVYAAGNGNNSVKERFTSSIINKIRSAKEKGLFTCIDKDSNSDFIAQSSLFMDKIIRLDNFAKELERKSTMKTGAAALGVLGILGSALFLSEYNQSAGLVVSIDSIQGPASPLSSFITLSFLVIIVAFAYKVMSPGRHKYYPVIKPGKADKRIRKTRQIQLRKDFKNKLSSWLANVREMVLF